MKKIIFTLVGISFLIFSCQNELLDLQESSIQSASMSSSDPSTVFECNVVDAERLCSNQYNGNFWWGTGDSIWFDGFFHSDTNNKMSFTEYSDGTANIKGSTILYNCTVEVDVWLKSKANWSSHSGPLVTDDHGNWISGGGTIKREGCFFDDIVKENLHFYVIDSENSTITASGDCSVDRSGLSRAGVYGVEQRPDPNDPTTPHLGVIVGPGGALHDGQGIDAMGLSTWGWLTKNGVRLDEHIIDFNFTFECPDVECLDCEGNVTELELQYNGDEEAHIIVETKDEGENGSKVVFEGDVAPGGTFIINGNDENGSFGDEIKVYVDGDYVKIKTDCSEAIGPGLIIEDIEVISGKSSNGAYLCPIPCDECEGKVTRLDLQYNGADKTIEIVQKKDGTEGTPLFSGPVSAGDEFTIYGQDDKGTLSTEIIITDASGTEIQRIHTSCSEPIGAGAVIGDFTVLGGASREGGELCPVETPPGGDCDECKGGVISFTVEYTGISDATLKVMEKDVEIFNAVILPGQLITLSGTKDDGKFEENNLIFTLNGNVLSAPEHDPGEIHVSCSKPFYVGLPIGDSLVVTAGTSKDNGTICEDTPPGGGDDCNECDGKVTRLDLIYNGNNTVQIDVVQKKDDISVFSKSVNTGETFSFSGMDDKGTLGTEIIIYVNYEEAQRIHTSCSDPIGAGSVFGDFTVEGGASLNGGEFCPVDTPPTGGGDDCNECDGKVTRLELQYSGSGTDSIKIVQKKDGEIVFNGTTDGNPIEIFGDWKKGTFGTELIIYVNGSEAQRIHTSCSVPIGVGSVFGDFTVLSGASYNGGEFCNPEGAS